MRIAVTGGIADGKSTVCAFLRELGSATVNADDLVGELHFDPDVIAQVKSELGERFVAGAALDRDGLRIEVSQNPASRAKLNAIFHPAVMWHILRDTETEGVAFAEVPLLIETATQGWFDEVWVVTAGATEQRKRLVERLKSERDADAMLSTQLPTAAKIPFADRVIRTNEPLDTVKSTIAEHVKELLEER
jgi:dephospho-CoA kinase